MSGRIRILRVMENPKRPKKKARHKGRKPAKICPGPARRGYVLRALVVGNRNFAHAEWWTGSAWRRGKRFARRYAGDAAARLEANIASQKAPSGCAAIDAVPV